VIPVQSLEYRADPPEQVIPSHLGVRYLTKKSEGYIEFDFKVDKPGRYQISGIFQDSFIGSMIQPYLDGDAIGLPIDMISVAGGFVYHSLDLHDLKAGHHTLRFEKKPGLSTISRSIRPNFSDFTIEYLILLRLEDMDGYHQLYDEKKSKR